MIKHLRVWAVLVGLFSSALGLAQQIPVVEKVLPNGFKVLLVERHEEPRIAAGWVVKVGSSNERPGITGIAHLFEHMMFKGTPTLGTRDAERDREIIEEQERIRDLMREEEAVMRAAYRRGEISDLQSPESHTPRYRELLAQFRELIEAHREVIVKDEFDRVYTKGGASRMNAFTNEDMTGYFIEVPSNKLELWCWMESERLYRPVFREFYAERDVVFEERRLRTESTPTGKFGEQFISMFWDAHPYHWPVIGWPSDIPAITKKQADEFYALFYQPQNITLILVGAFDTANALEQIERYFGRIPAGTQPPPEVLTLEPQQQAEKRMLAEAETNPQVDILWKTVAFGHPDSYALDVVQLLLSGRTGRLYKGLVLGRENATDTFAQQDSRKWAGLFNLGAEVRDGSTPESVEAALYEELEVLKETLVPDQELQKVKNQFAAAEFRKLRGNFAIFIQLLFNEGLGDWREVNEAAPKIQAVTAADVQRVVQKYFTQENRAVAIYTRKPGTGGEDPEFAGLSPEQIPVVRQIIATLQQETDADKLKEMLAQLDAQAESQDPRRQQFQRILRERIADRLTQLESK
jgi:predicted Zn-dependent peptidase